MPSAPPLPPFSGGASVPIDLSLLLLGNEIEAKWGDDGSWHRAIVYSEPTKDTVGVLFPALQTRAVIPLGHVRAKPSRSGFITAIDSLASSPASSSRNLEHSISSSRGSSPHLADLSQFGQRPHKSIFASASRAWSSFSRTRSESPAVSRSKGFSISSFPRTRSPSPVAGKTSSHSSSESSPSSESSSSSEHFFSSEPSSSSSSSSSTSTSTTTSSSITVSSSDRAPPKPIPFAIESSLIIPTSDTPAEDTDPPSPYSDASWNGSPNSSQVYEDEDQYADAVTGDGEDDPQTNEVFVAPLVPPIEVSSVVAPVTMVMAPKKTETTTPSTTTTTFPAAFTTLLNTPKFAPRKPVLLASATPTLSTSRSGVPLSPVPEARGSESFSSPSIEEKQLDPSIVIPSPALLRKLSPAPIRGPGAASQKPVVPMFEQTSSTQKIASLIAQFAIKETSLDSSSSLKQTPSTEVTPATSREPSPSPVPSVALPKSFPLMMNLFQPGSLPSLIRPDTLPSVVSTNNVSSAASIAISDNDNSRSDSSSVGKAITAQSSSSFDATLNAAASSSVGSLDTTGSERAQTTSEAESRSRTLSLAPSTRTRSMTVPTSASCPITQPSSSSFDNTIPVALLAPSFSTSAACLVSTSSSSLLLTMSAAPLESSILVSSSAQTEAGLGPTNALHEESSSTLSALSTELPEISDIVDVNAAHPFILRPRAATSAVPLNATATTNTAALVGSAVVLDTSPSVITTRSRTATAVTRPRGPSAIVPSISTHSPESSLSVNTLSPFLPPISDSPSTSTPGRRATTVAAPDSLSPNPPMRAKWKDLFSSSPSSPPEEKQAKKASLWHFLKPSPKSSVIQHAISSPMSFDSLLPTATHVSTTPIDISSNASVDTSTFLPAQSEELSLPTATAPDLSLLSSSSSPSLPSSSSSSSLPSSLSSSSACSSHSLGSSNPGSSIPVKQSSAPQSRLRTPDSLPLTSPATRSSRKVLFRSSVQSTSSATPSPELANNRSTTSSQRSRGQVEPSGHMKSKASISPQPFPSKSLGRSLSPSVSSMNHSLSPNLTSRRTVSLSPHPRSAPQKQTHLTRSASLESNLSPSQKMSTSLSPQLLDALAPDSRKNRHGSGSAGEDDFKLSSLTALQSPRGRSPVARDRQTTSLNRQQQRQQQQQQRYQQQPLQLQLSPSAFNNLSISSIQQPQMTQRRASPQVRPGQRQQTARSAAEQAVGPPSRATSPGMHKSTARPLLRSEANLQSPSLRPISAQGFASLAEARIPHEIEDVPFSISGDIDQSVPTRSRATAVVQNKQAALPPNNRSPGRHLVNSRQASVGSLSNFVLSPQQASSQSRQSSKVNPARTPRQNVTTPSVSRSSRPVQSSTQKSHTPQHSQQQSSQSFKKPVFSSSARKNAQKHSSPVKAQPSSSQTEILPLHLTLSPNDSHHMICPDPSAHIHLHDPQSNISFSAITNQASEFSEASVTIPLHSTRKLEDLSSTASRSLSNEMEFLKPHHGSSAHMQSPYVSSKQSQARSYSSEHLPYGGNGQSSFQPLNENLESSDLKSSALSSHPVIHLHNSYDHLSNSPSLKLDMSTFPLRSPSNFSEPLEDIGSLSTTVSSDELYHRWWMETHLLEGECLGHLFVLPRISPRAEVSARPRFDVINEEY